MNILSVVNTTDEHSYCVFHVFYCVHWIYVVGIGIKYTSTALMMMSFMPITLTWDTRVVIGLYL